jgi:hypothetical protein
MRWEEDGMEDVGQVLLILLLIFVVLIPAVIIWLLFND